MLREEGWGKVSVVFQFIPKVFNETKVEHLSSSSPTLVIHVFVGTDFAVTDFGFLVLLKGKLSAPANK